MRKPNSKADFSMIEYSQVFKWIGVLIWKFFHENCMKLKGTL